MMPGALRWRNFLWQAALLLLVAFLIYGAATNAYVNLQRQNVALGWGFLENTAGFAISQTLIEYSELSTYFDAFVVGLLNTLLVAALGIVFASILGFVIGIARLSPNWLVAKLALVYIEFIRNVPLVLQLVFWYTAVLGALPAPRQSLSVADAFFLSNRGLLVPRILLDENFVFVLWAFVLAIVIAIGLRLYSRQLQAATGRRLPVLRAGLASILVVPVLAYYAAGQPVTLDYPQLQGFNFTGGTQMLPEFVALLLGIVLYTAAFIAEIVRAGVQAVPKGQLEAAYASGLARRHVLRLVVVPQALSLIIPPLTSQYLNLIKNSSLAVAVGYPELFTVAGTINNQTGQAIEVIVITMGVYLLLTLGTSALMNIYNARMALVER